MSRIVQILFILPFLLALSPGERAPGFSAQNQNGITVKLADFRGRFLLLYFYPLDESPGCTTEACNLRDQYGKIRAMNAAVLGVSRQDQTSHEKFAQKNKLPFGLLVDSDGEIAKKFEVGTVEGHPDRTLRQSFLIGPDGKILQVYKNVDPANHVNEIIADIEKASAKAK